MLPRRMQIANWLFVASLSYGALAIAAFLGQRRLIYPAPRGSAEPHASGAQLWRITAANDVRVVALYAPAPEGAPTLVHFHGNGEDLSNQTTLIGELRRSGIGVCAVEYPGYGLLRGEPIDEASVYASAEAALLHLIDLGVPRDSIVLQGQSLGTGVATEMARRGYGTRLVLISPYTSMVDMAARVTPFLPVSLLVRDRYESYRKAASVSVPALVIHGTDDEVVPFSMGRRMADLLPHAVFVAVAGGGHNDLLSRSDFHVTARIAAFAKGEPTIGSP